MSFSRLPLEIVVKIVRELDNDGVDYSEIDISQDDTEAEDIEEVGRENLRHCQLACRMLMEASLLFAFKTSKLLLVEGSSTRMCESFTQAALGSRRIARYLRSFTITNECEGEESTVADITCKILFKDGIRLDRLGISGIKFGETLPKLKPLARLTFLGITNAKGSTTAFLKSVDKLLEASLQLAMFILEWSIEDVGSVLDVERLGKSLGRVKESLRSLKLSFDVLDAIHANGCLENLASFTRLWNLELPVSLFLSHESNLQLSQGGPSVSLPPGLFCIFLAFPNPESDREDFLFLNLPEDFRIRQYGEQVSSILLGPRPSSNAKWSVISIRRKELEATKVRYDCGSNS